MTTKKIRKRSNNLGPHPVVDQAKELGVALERTTLKSNKRRSSGKKFKTKIPGMLKKTWLGKEASYDLFECMLLSLM